MQSNEYYAIIASEKCLFRRKMFFLEYNSLKIIYKFINYED